MAYQILWHSVCSARYLKKRHKQRGERDSRKSFSERYNLRVIFVLLCEKETKLVEISTLILKLFDANNV